MTPTYRFTTAIEVGSYAYSVDSGPAREFIEKPAVVKQKLEDGYIPLGRAELTT